MTPVGNQTLAARATSAHAAYEIDLYAWALEQGRLLRAGRLSEVDRDNLAEEIEALARSQFDRFTSSLRLVIMHMLKWDHQPVARSRSWLLSIAVHRVHAQDVLADNPSLKARWDEAIARAYKVARLEAAKEMKVDVSSLPTVCPYGAEDILKRPFPTGMDEA